MTTERARIAILISGRGSNMEAILAKRDAIDADFVGVISSREDAAGLQKADALGLVTRCVPSAAHPTREGYDAALLEVLRDLDADFLVLAGFMRILTDAFVERFAGRIINIHPSLLPAFPGLHAQRQALEAGVKVAGCTVHFVAPGAVDSGPIIAQAPVPVYADDDEASLSARIQVQEHRIYPAALQALVGGAMTLRGGRVVERSHADAIALVG